MDERDGGRHLVSAAHGKVGALRGGEGYAASSWSCHGLWGSFGVLQRLGGLVESNSCLVIVAQLAEHRVVVPKVAGSSPVGHPRKSPVKRGEAEGPWFTTRGLSTPL